MKKILVLGATGLQGKLIVKELLTNGFSVHAMVRSDNHPFVGQNVETVIGDLFDEDSLYHAMQGLDSVVFVPVIPSTQDDSYEFQIGKNVVSAAERAGIQYLLHTSVDRAGEQESFSHWHNMLNKAYWTGKSQVIESIKHSTIPHWTILKPVFLMETFLPPKVLGMYPNLAHGEMLTARLPETKLGLLSADDLAKIVAQAFLHWQDFDKQEIPLASDYLTTEEIAHTISQTIDKPIQVIYKTPEEIAHDDELEQALRATFPMLPQGFRITDSLADGLIWDNVDGYTADVAKSDQYGVALMDFKTWCERHQSEFNGFIHG